MYPQTNPNKPPTQTNPKITLQNYPQKELPKRILPKKPNNTYQSCNKCMFVPQMYKDPSILRQIHKGYHLPLLIQKELDTGLTLVYSCRIINTLFCTVHAWIS